MGGEIIRDSNDPRLRRPVQQASQAQPSRGHNTLNIHPQPDAQRGIQGDPLQWLSNALGIADRCVQIPAFLSFPSVALPLIYVIVAALVCVFFGWRGAVGVAVAYFVYVHSLTKPQQQQPQQAPQRN